MTDSRKNRIFRISILLINILILGSFASATYFGVSIDDITSFASATAKETDSANPTEKGPGSLQDNEAAQVAITREQSQDPEQQLSDGSKVTRMEDGFGNSTVTRRFGADELVKMVIVRFGLDDQRTVFVYGKNGSVAMLPVELQDSVLTLSAGQLADAVGINSAATENDRREMRISTLRANQQREAEEKRKSEMPVYTEPQPETAPQIASKPVDSVSDSVNN